MIVEPLLTSYAQRRMMFLLGEPYMNLKQVREYRGMDRRMLEAQTKISFRSIQDYEQGHKILSHANYETLYKLSLALACPVNILVGDDFSKELMESVDRLCCYSEEYKTWGSLRFYGNICHVEYVYDGKTFSDLFMAKPNEKDLPFQRAVARFMMEDGIEDYCFNKRFKGGR